jgi:hypothetical protein
LRGVSKQLAAVVVYKQTTHTYIYIYIYQSCRLQGWIRIVMPGAKQACFKFAVIWKAVRDKQFEVSIYVVLPQWVRGFWR